MEGIGGWEENKKQKTKVNGKRKDDRGESGNPAKETGWGE